MLIAVCAGLCVEPQTNLIACGFSLSQLVEVGQAAQHRHGGHCYLHRCCGQQSLHTMPSVSRSTLRYSVTSCQRSTAASVKQFDDSLGLCACRLQDEASSWEARLSTLLEGLSLLQSIQRRWLYLEPIFGRGALPAVAGRFRHVDGEFRAIMLQLQVWLCGKGSHRAPKQGRKQRVHTLLNEWNCVEGQSCSCAVS